jgi:hypothetical protein
VPYRLGRFSVGGEYFKSLVATRLILDSGNVIRNCELSTGRPTRYYSPGLLYGGLLSFGDGLCDAAGLELGVVMVPSGVGLVASSPL